MLRTTSDIITTTNFTQFTFYTNFIWRVRAIRGDKKSGWSKISHFFGNPRLNRVGLYLPIPENLTDVPRTFPIFYQPTTYFSDVQITVADNIEFSSPLFEKNYSPFAEITDIIQNLPANKLIFLRVRERNSEHLSYADRNLVDYTIWFTTGNKQIPAPMTFMTSLNQAVFGRPSPKIAVSNDHVRMGEFNQGFIKMDQKSLNYNLLTRSNTDGLLGTGLEVPVHTDSNSNVHILNPGNSQSYRAVKLANENASPSAEITRFFSSYIYDFNPQYKLYWTFTEIYQQVGSGLNLIKQIPQNQQIRQISVHDNKAWILLINTNSDTSEIMVMEFGTEN